MEAHASHDLIKLVIQLGTILIAARIGRMLALKIKLPGAIGELLMGVAIGPLILGGHAISSELEGICALAAILLLFGVGLETEIALLLRYSVAGALAGLGGVVIAYLAGAGAVVFFAGNVLGGDVGWMSPPALMMGVIATATSVGITARILSDLKRLDSPEGVTTLAAAVIDDVLGIVMLAVVMGLVSASDQGSVDWGSVGMIALKAISIWLAATAIGILASRRLSALLKWFKHRTAIAISAFALALILGGLFEKSGLAMIIGAYVMGLSLSQADVRHVVREKLDPVHQFLVPVFFCVMGMRIDLSSLTSGAVLGFGLIYALACMAGKVFGAGGPALLAGFNQLGALRIGVGMAPRCEVALTIAGIALAAGLVEAPMFAAVVIMVLVNTLIAGPTLQMLYRRGGAGLRNPDPGDDEHRECTFDFPNRAITRGVLEDLQVQFNDEGFYVHCLSHHDRLYQALKGDIAIDFSGAGSQIHIRCKASHLALANALMNEALADLERTIRELKPMDARAVRQVVTSEAVPSSGHATFTESLHPERIVASLLGDEKHAVINELLDVAARSGLVADIESAREAVFDREASMPTGLEQGIAMPHARTDAVGDLVCIFGVHRSGVDFGAFDGEPSQLVALVLAPPNKPGYVQFIAGLTQTLQVVDRKRLFANSGAEGVYAVICNARSE
jgi:Kef-type K+ transport system membrane component KefB/mannitol/fructose-specific phosphotransferase system IIA component (Ntr-type)